MSVTTVVALAVAGLAGITAWQVGPSWWWAVLLPAVLLALLVAMAWAAPDATPLTAAQRPIEQRRDVLILGPDLGAAPGAARDALAVTLAARTTIQNAGGTTGAWVPDAVLDAAVWDVATRVLATAEMVTATNELRRESRNLGSPGGLHYRRTSDDAAALDAATKRTTRAVHDLTRDAGTLRDAAARATGSSTGHHHTRGDTRPPAGGDGPVHHVWELVTARADAAAQVAALHDRDTTAAAGDGPKVSRWWR